MKSENKKIYIMAAVLLLIAVMPYLLAACYALPCADEITNVQLIRKCGGHNIGGVVNFVKYNLSSWQGCFFGKALESLFNPLNDSYVTIWINVFLISVIILFTAIILYWVYQQTYLFMNNRATVFVLAACVLLMCFNGRVKQELFFWFTGACDYTIPLAMGLLVVSILIKEINTAKNQSEDESKIKRGALTFAAALLGFCTCGGSLQIAGYFCWILLVILAMSIVMKKNVKASAVIFLATLAGALTNAAAPGNYVRKTYYGQVSLMRGGYYSLIAVFHEIDYIFSETYIPWILFGIIVVAFIFWKGAETKLFHPVLVGSVTIIGWLISTFPVCYGYGDSTLQDRGLETLDIYIAIGLYVFALSLVNYLKSKNIGLSKNAVIWIIILVFLNLGYAASLSIMDEPGMQCLVQAASGELKDYHDEWIRVFEEIENSADSEEAILYFPISQKNYSSHVVVKHPGLMDNMDSFVNQGVAQMLGKEAVIMSVEETGGIESEK